MLSSLPKLADKAFIIGFLLPVIIFLAALLALFSDLPWVKDKLNTFTASDKIEKIVYISLLVWSLSILLMTVNHSLYQIVEGYRWPISKLAQLWSREDQRFTRKSRRFEELGRKWSEAGNQFQEKFKQEYNDLRVELVTRFPSEKRLVLPTRFGNAIRAFEDYSRRVYGADSIPLWLHLGTVMPKDFQSSVEDARAQVSFLLNLMLFSSIIFVLSIVRFIIELPLPHSVNDISAMFQSVATVKSMSFILFAVGAALLGWLSYEISIERIEEWGGLVKAAFDCYLPDLARKLGYKLPLTGDDQKRFWTAVS